MAVDHVVPEALGRQTLAELASWESPNVDRPGRRPVYAPTGLGGTRQSLELRVVSEELINVMVLDDCWG